MDAFQPKSLKYSGLRSMCKLVQTSYWGRLNAIESEALKSIPITVLSLEKKCHTM